MAEFDEVPPLEDMSEVLAAAARLRKSRHVGLHQSATQTSASVVETIAGKETCTPVVKVHEVSKDSRTDKSSSSTMKSKPPVASTLSGASSSSSGFGGMKKGFLLDSGRKKQSKAQVTPHPKPSDAAASSVPLIKPNQPKDASRVLPEVQKAMKAAMSALEKKEWITDDLLDKISSHPTIGPKLSDPRYSAALDCFQKNPQQASKEYRGQPEIQAFLRDFCRILGEHFTSLGEKQKAKEISKSDAAAMPNLRDKNVREALEDPNIQQLIQQLKEGPENAKRLLACLSHDADFHRKIRVLIDAGVLGVSNDIVTPNS